MKEIQMIDNQTLTIGTCMFVPFKSSMINISDIAQLKTLYEHQQNNEEVSMLLGVKPNMSLKGFMNKVYSQNTIWKQEAKNVYIVKSTDGIVAGIATVQPLRLWNSTYRVDYAIDVLLTNPEQSKRIKELYVKAYHNQESHTLMQKLQQSKARFFAPMQNEQLESMTCIPNLSTTKGIAIWQNKFKNVDTTFLSQFPIVMPKNIQSADRDFSLKRLDVSNSNGMEFYNFIQNNRHEIKEFFPGLSNEFTSAKAVTSLLGNGATYEKGKLTLHYGIFAGNKLVGYLNCPIGLLSAQIEVLVDKNANNRGYASEALRLLEREFFKHGIKEISILTAMNNYKMQSVLIKNKYCSDLYDENDSFLNYYKLLSDYVKGTRANKSLLKSNEPQKVQVASKLPLSTDFSRECRA